MIYFKKAILIFFTLTLFEANVDASFLETVKTFFRWGSPNSLLLEAIKKVSLEEFEVALDRGADIKKVLTDENAIDINAKDAHNMTLLMYAAESGQTEIAELLIENGANVNEQGYQNITALMYAANSGQTEIAELLIKKGANVDAQDGQGWTALMFALIPRSPDLRAYDKIHEMTALLIVAGADLYKENNNGMPALSFADRNPHLLRHVLQVKKRKNATHDPTELLESVDIPPAACEQVLKEMSLKSKGIKKGSNNLSSSKITKNRKR